MLWLRFAKALDDPRQQEFTQHAFTEMARMRIYGIVADYEDQNDHDVLRSDPVFKLIAGRSLESMIDDGPRVPGGPSGGSYHSITAGPAGQSILEKLHLPARPRFATTEI